MRQDRWYNPLMRWLLRSPFHGLVSRGILLVTFTGRKTGRTYSTPINYRQDGPLIQLISHRGRAWWRNFEGGAPVTLRLRGQDRQATANVVAASRDDLMRALCAVYPGLPAARGAQLLNESVLIHVRLGESAGQLAPEVSRQSAL